jgi:hypothetical protein
MASPRVLSAWSRARKMSRPNGRDFGFSPLTQRAKVRGDTIEMNSLIFVLSGFPSLTSLACSAGVTSICLESLERKMRFSASRYSVTCASSLFVNRAIISSNGYTNRVIAIQSVSRYLQWR